MPGSTGFYQRTEFSKNVLIASLPKTFLITPDKRRRGRSGKASYLAQHMETTMPAPRALRRRALASVAPLLAASATAQPPAPASPQQFKLEYGANSLVFTGNLNLSVDHTEVTGQPAA